MLHQTNRYLSLCVATCLLMICTIHADDTHAGVLDEPLQILQSPAKPGKPTSIPNLGAARPDFVKELLKEKFDSEQKALKKLPLAQLKKKAESGERAAQVTLAEDYAREAEMLAFAPAAANDALSDAVRWYSLAAKRGFPGAPSLDQAGVKFYPIRAQRTR